MAARIYLDHNATQPLLPAARAALLEALDIAGNPSSVHAEGRQARAVVEKARQAVADLVAASSENVVFTASATEAAVTCLSPRWLRDGREIGVDRLAVVDTDHPSTREGGQFPPGAVTRLPVDADGVLDFDALDAWLDGVGERTAMLAVCLANGETGVIQPLHRIQASIAGRNVILVLDVVQAAGRLPLSVDTLGADVLLLSGHKIGAAKGVGAFVLRSDHLRPFRLLSGGGQEKGLRSGTEAVPAIASFGAAAKVAAARSRDSAHSTALRERVVRRLRSNGCEFTLLGESAPRLPNTLAITAPGLRAETAQIALDLEGFAVSAGSACSSGKVGPSHVLAAMAAGGLNVDPILGFVRVSFGPDTTQVEADAFADAFARLAARARTATRSLEAA